MGCCCSALLGNRPRQRDAERGWHENDETGAREMSMESDNAAMESKMELEGVASSTLPAELESPVETSQPPQHQRSEGDEPPPYSPGVTTTQQQVVMNREARISHESRRSIQPGRASEDSGFEKRERGSISEDPGFDNRKYRGVVL